MIFKTIDWIDPVCENCTHWKEKKGRFEPLNYGKCRCEKFIYTGEICGKPVLEDDDCLLFEDNEGYAASFRTGKNFRCKYWKMIK